MSKGRPTFSVRRRYYRWLRYGAERLERSGCSLAEQAIERLMAILAIPEPPDDWMPKPGKGRPKKTEKPRVGEQPDQHMFL